MPALPELADVLGEVGEVEVARQVIAEDAGAADGHVRVAGEVAVDLDGIGVGHQQQGPGAVGVGRGVHGVDEDAEVVGQHDLLEQAEGEVLHAEGESLRRDGPLLVELGDEIPGLDDGSGHELREEGDVQRGPHEIALGRYLAAGDVDGVAERLEGIEGDADGQEDAQRPGAGDAEERAEGVDEEVEVLEHAEDQQRQHDADAQREAAALPVHVQGADMGGERQPQHQRAAFPVPPAVEDIARQKQQEMPDAHALFPLHASERGGVGQGGEGADEGEEDREGQTVEQHAQPSLSAIRAATASAKSRWPSRFRWPARGAVLEKPKGRTCRSYASR